MHNMSNKINPISPTLSQLIVNALEDAVGDDTKAIIYGNDLEGTTCGSFFAWPLINRNISQSLFSVCEISRLRRGPWETLILFDKASKCIFTLMREDRFSTLRKNQSRQKHYLHVFALLFNNSLQSPQTTLFDSVPADPIKEEIAGLAQKILRDINTNNCDIQHHVLVLFKTTGFQLTQVRAVMVTPTLDIAIDSEQDLSKYIRSTESVIVEKIVDSASPENQPTRGLTLKPKALKRKHNKLQTKHTDTTTQKRSQ